VGKRRLHGLNVAKEAVTAEGVRYGKPPESDRQPSDAIVRDIQVTAR
jgi:hypothetical protein